MAGGTGKALPLHVQISRKLHGDVSTDWLNCSIFKVPNHLRQINKQAYEPQVIAIGPYHHGKNPQLEKMEVYKMFYLKMLLRRRRESGLERYVTALEGMEEKARKFYSEPINHSGGENFVEMMLLDGCFIIELIRKTAMKEQRDPNDHLLTHFILRRAILDLLLVENQLPFFILSKLFDMTVMQDDEAKDFMGMTISFLSIMMPLPGSQISRPKKKDVMHLLGLLHDCWTFLPAPQEVHITCSPGNLEPHEEVKYLSHKEVRSLSPKVKLTLCSSEVLPDVRVIADYSSDEDLLVKGRPKLIPCAAPLVRFPPPKESNPSISSESSEEEEIVPIESIYPERKEWGFIRSATELREAGINFKKIEGRLFDIEFQKGVMSIPTLTINDDTESILRNLVAYEQCFKRTSPKYFTDYITFMDCLINTGKDVELLCRRKVIDNWLGDHEVVAAKFNKLRDSVLISEEDFSYAKIFKKVNDHCDRKWNQSKANLWHNYFNTPWASISFLAAVFLLLLTVLQSVFSVLSYLFK
ncbi:hypothetical protein SLA2020_142800 [Shorea laevis]